jgi:hypothetical protein
MFKVILTIASFALGYWAKGNVNVTVTRQEEDNDTGADQPASTSESA